MGFAIAIGETTAEDEAAVERALRRLPDGWVALHDVPWPGRPHLTIDHVVVGPAGVFVIEAESWTGTIEVRDGELTHDGQSREQAVDLAARAAIAIQGRVPARCFPVLCFAGPLLSGWAREVMICSASTVRLKLVSLPDRLSPDDVRRCVEALRTTPGRRARARLRLPRSSGERSVRPTLMFLGVLELVVSVIVLLAPGGLQDAADWVDQAYTSVVDDGEQPATKPGRKRGAEPEQRRTGR